MNILLPQPSERIRYRRLNPCLKYEPPNLDKVAAMKGLKIDAGEIMMNDQKISDVAHQLIASSFYFENSGRTLVLSNGFTRYQGSSLSEYQREFYITNIT